MLSKKLNIAAKNYLGGKCSFTDVYEPFAEIYEKRYQKISSLHGLDIHDVQAVYEDALMKSLRIFNPCRGIFTHLLNVTIRNGVMDLRRKQATLQRKEVLYSTIPITIPSRNNPEKEVINKEISDKRGGLIAGITGSNFTGKMKNVLQKIAIGQSIHSAATQSGLCHKTAKRRLAKLASFYDSAKYGKIQDYLY